MIREEHSFQDNNFQVHSSQIEKESDVYAFPTYNEVKENITCIFFSEYESSEQVPFVKYIYPEQKSSMNYELK